MSMYKVIDCIRLGILKVVQYNPRIMSPHVCNFQHEKVSYVCRNVYNTSLQTNVTQLPGIIQCLSYLPPLNKIIYRIHMPTMFHILYTYTHT
jgi:hypothetical protein